VFGMGLIEQNRHMSKEGNGAATVDGEQGGCRQGPGEAM